MIVRLGLEQILALKRINLTPPESLPQRDISGGRLDQGFKSTSIRIAHLALVARTLVWKELGLEKPMEILWVVTLL